MRIFTILCLLSAAVFTEDLYRGGMENVIPLSERNWGGQVVKGRTDQKVFIVHFYKSNDGQSNDFSVEFSKFSTKSKGLYKFGGIDCQVQGALCSKEGVTTFPTVKIYPPLPLPPFVPEEAGLNIKRISAWAAGYVPSNVEKVTDDNINGILNSNPSVPKVLLLTDKDKTPLLWKAISNAFKGKLFVGIAKSDQKDVVYKFNVQKFPAIVIHKAGERRPIVFKGKISFQNIFEFLNVHSEEFVAGGESSSTSTDDTKPWSNKAVPELFKESAKDVCLGIKKVYCVIAFNAGKPDEKAFSALKEIRRAYDNKLGRSAKFRFMWADSTKQTAWMEKMEITETPTLIVLNPGRRKRYLKKVGPITEESLNNQLEKILGGDSRFTMFRPNQLPELK